MGVDDELVLSGEAGKGDAGRCDHLGEVEVCAVETDALDACGDGVDERRQNSELQ